VRAAGDRYGENCSGYLDDASIKASTVQVSGP
jgi:hypothetical protein